MYTSQLPLGPMAESAMFMKKGITNQYPYVCADVFLPTDIYHPVPPQQTQQILCGIKTAATLNCIANVISSYTDTHTHSNVQINSHWRLMISLSWK